MPDIRTLFEDGGALHRALHNYRPRPGQIEMAQRVQAVLAEGGGRCVLEAGTGIGKTFAYLTPIIQSGKSVLISTGARALQDQLSGKDIPLLKKALGRDLSVAVLKGRANYVCKKEMEDDSELFEDDASDWQKIRYFADRSEDGDVRGITDVPSHSRLLARAVSTRESCNTQACKHYETCFLYRARARARKADIVIVNHHLFLSDMRLRDEGVAELLPARDVVLFDEAHQLPELAPKFFGERTSSTQLRTLMGQLERTAKKMKEKGAVLFPVCRSVRDALEKWQEASNSCVRAGNTATAAEVLADAEWMQCAQELAQALRQLARTLMNKAGEDEAMEKYAQRVLSDIEMLSTWLAGEQAKAEAKEKEEVGAAEKADEVTAQSNDDPIVRWAEQEASGNIALHSAPMTGRNLFARQWEKVPTLFFTSATLSVGGDFSDFCEAAGIADAETHHWESPYDFPNRALLYLPPQLPLPNKDSAAHTQAVVDAALPLLMANGGRAFMLFTSWRALNQAHEQLQPLLQEAGITILKQGEMANDELLLRFRAETRAVLLGSQSFWQGVDVRGEALSLLVVDKIPFTPPSDPLLKARDDWRKRSGENPFMRNQLPPAVLLMKQVAGRLIRDYEDYGVFMMGDPRLLKKNYGKTILSALPPMRRCEDGPEAEAFLRQWSARRARSHAAADSEDTEEEEGWE